MNSRRSSSLQTSFARVGKGSTSTTVIGAHATPPVYAIGAGDDVGSDGPESARTPEPETSLADRIREFVARHYVAPARERGDSTVTIVVGEVHREMGLKQRHPAIIAALRARVFSEAHGVRRREVKGPGQSSRTVFAFELLPQP